MTDFSTISSAAETISRSGAKDFPQEVAKEEGLTLASNFWCSRQWPKYLCCPEFGIYT